MKCNLCLNEVPLAKQSHIYPQFLYESIKRVNFIQKEIIEKYIKSFPRQTPEFDKNILCLQCENEKFGQAIEGVAKEELLKVFNLNLRSVKILRAEDGSKFSIISGIDYNKLKLFLLSILWRSSVTNRIYFSEVKLNPANQERIRDILYNKREIDIYEYPIFATSLLHFNDIFRHNIGQPKEMSYYSNLDGYSFLINGIVFHIIVNSSGNSLPESIKDCVLNKKNELTLFFPDAEKELSFYMKMFL
ncbi:hypothetical protein ACWGOQ_0002705 [Aquimarina sp. M1]